MGLLGYARVSTSDQSAAGQLDALTAAGCDRVWTEVASGTRARRTALDELLAAATAGDTVVVTEAGRARAVVAASTSTDRGSVCLLGMWGLRSLAEQIDTASATGRLVLHVFGALAEFERELNHERTRSGLAAARARGRVGGRPKALNSMRLQHARDSHPPAYPSQRSRMC